MSRSAPDVTQPEIAERGPGWWPLAELRGVAETYRLRRIGLFWLLAVAVSVGSGVANVSLGWNGLSLSFFGLPFEVTVYPPFVLSVLLALWLGPTWAAIPIYLANLASALASGMSLPMSLLFAVAGVVETLILWGALVSLRIDPDLRRRRDVAWFLAAGLVAAVTGSLAAILWNTSHDLDPVVGQRIWRGWVIGDLLQLALLALPVLRLAGPRVRGWIDRQLVSPPLRELDSRHAVVLTASAFAVLGLVVFLGVHQALGSIEDQLGTRGAGGELLVPKLREIVLVMGLLLAALILATGIFSTALARMGERRRREALVDGLTGCYNRRAFGTLFGREAERSRRLGLGLGLLFGDLDRFKELNDRHGHEAGDLALVRAARRIESALRETDLLFRWGGEEFVVLMPHTRVEEIGEIADRVRTALAAEPLAALPGGDELRLTVSLGAAATARFPCDPAELVRRADEACYEAKRQGRNRTVTAPAA